MAVKEKILTLHFTHSEEKPGMTLCGRKADESNQAWDGWGGGPLPKELYKEFDNYRYCKKCEKLADAEQEKYA